MVEYDGEQHFKPVRFGNISLKEARKNLKKQKKIDNLDTLFCNKNNIILCRIKYNEDKYLSIKKLKDIVYENK